MSRGRVGRLSTAPGRRRRAAPALAAVVAGLLLSGCAQIPTSGPVREGDEVLAPGEDPLIRVLPRPPAPGSGPEEVVRGFLSASAGFIDDHAVARLYLTPEASATWDAGAGVSIYDDAQPVDLVENGSRVGLRAVAEGRIDATGALLAYPAPTVRATYRLTDESGEWRIAALPQGLVLGRADVERSFRSLDVYFLTPEGDRLVPDPVFIPVARPGAATTLVRTLLDGPTTWLAPAVTSAVPPGTTTVVDSVPVSNGVAAVDLSAEALDTDQAARERMAAQLVWTLTQLPEVSAVTISVAGSPLQLPSAPTEQTTQTWIEFGPDRPSVSSTTTSDSYLVRRGAMAEQTGGLAEPVPGRLGAGDPRLGAVSADPSGQQLAAVTADRTSLLFQLRFAPDTVESVVSGRDLTAPSFDAYSRLWVAGRSDGRLFGSLRDVEGDVVPVEVRALRGRVVSALQVAADGTRAAVVAAPLSGGSAVLLLTRVVRRGAEVAIEAPRRLERTLVDVRDIAWGGAGELVVLGRRAGEPLQVYRVGIDGQVSPAVGPLAGLTSVASSPGRPVLVETDAGQIWQESDVGWRLLLRGRAPAYPG